MLNNANYYYLVPRRTNTHVSARIRRGKAGVGVMQSPGELWTGGSWVSCRSWWGPQPGAHSTAAVPYHSKMINYNVDLWPGPILKYHRHSFFLLSLGGACWKRLEFTLSHRVTGMGFNNPQWWDGMGQRHASPGLGLHTDMLFTLHLTPGSGRVFHTCIFERGLTPLLTLG